MQEEVKAFGQALGRAIVGRDFAAAHGMLAPWLQNNMTPADLQQQIEGECAEFMALYELSEDTPLYPADFTLDGNSCTLEDLKAEPSYREGRSIPPEVTTENFRKWMVIEFLPDPEEEREFDAYFDWWMIAVDVIGQLKVGYYEIEDPD